jgi:hypothetical protein
MYCPAVQGKIGLGYVPRSQATRLLLALHPNPTIWAETNGKDGRALMAELVAARYGSLQGAAIA